MSGFANFLKKKDIEFSAKRYFIDALGYMALGLFSTLIIGLIIETLGQQTANLFGKNPVSDIFVELGGVAKSLMGAGIGIAVSYGLKAPPLVAFCGAVTGMMGAAGVGGPAGAFIAAVVGCEFGKAVSKETKLDIIITPATVLIIGILAAKTGAQFVGLLMTGLGDIIMRATEMQPFFMGIIVSVIMGVVLTAPISSAALAISMQLGGLAAGAATVGCCAQMVGFAVMSYRENKFGGLVAQGLGTSMLQVPNIVKNLWIIVPPILSSAVLGTLATMVFKMTNNPAGAGMGTSGLVGQINTFLVMGFNVRVLIYILLLHFILPAILTCLFYIPLKKLGYIKDGDMKLEM